MRNEYGTKQDEIRKSNKRLRRKPPNAPMSDQKRRTIVKAVGGIATVGLLAGCAEDGGENGDEEPATDTETEDNETEDGGLTEDNETEDGGLTEDNETEDNETEDDGLMEDNETTG